MIASKVSFSQHTKELLNARPLSRTAKSKLRRQRIVEYIRELPFGECQRHELITAGGWNISDQSQYSSGWSFIKGLQNKNVIRMSDGTNPRNTYVKKWEVVADTRVTKPADHTVTNDHGKMTYPEGDGETTLKPVIGIRTDGALPPRPPMPMLEPVISQPDDLLEQAKNFAWNTNSDSLREFIAWVKR